MSWQCITVHYNKSEESLIYFAVCNLQILTVYQETVYDTRNILPEQHKQDVHYWCCHKVTVWYNCFVFICYLVVRFQLIMTLPCSAACLLCPDASREVQTTFTPKITFRVPLSPSAPSREGEGLPVTLGGVIQMVHQMCGQSTWWESAAVLRALRTALDALVLMKCVFGLMSAAEVL